MCQFTITVSLSATENESALSQALGAVLQSGVERVSLQVNKLLSKPISPPAMFAFENHLRESNRELSRAVLECVLHHVEPEKREEVPARIRTGFADEYRCRPKSRLSLATLFGVVVVYRFLYEPLLAGEKCLFPLDLWTGVEAGHVSPALAEKIARLAAEQSQGDLLKTLEQEHGVKLSVDRLRTVIAGVTAGIAPFVLPVRVERLTQLLEAAFKSKGPHLPTLAVGRDGCAIPIRDENYKVASTATLSVMDRRGKRLGTVYLGQMPQENQVSLTAELDELLQSLLKAWSGPLPRLVYITDSGHQETQYWSKLRKMRHPKTGERLVWQRMVDFYHACQYVNRLGIAIFGEGRDANRWFQKMRRLLRDEAHGAQRVLSSASALRSTREPLSGKRDEEYQTCYGYLLKRLRFIDYFDYRRNGLPIGSGITEAACKIVFTQRFKRSGMTWKRESGQHILLLRTLTLSGLWPKVFHARLASTVHAPTLPQRANGPMAHVVRQKAA